MSYNNVRVVLLQWFSLVPVVSHVAAHLMQRYQQKGESLQEFNFKFIYFIQAITNQELKDITDLLNMSMYTQNCLL